MKTLFFDIMADDKYIFTLRYRYCPAFQLDIDDVLSKVLQARPSLKDKPFKIYADIEDLTSK